MHGISLHIERVSEPLSFSPDYDDPIAGYWKYLVGITAGGEDALHHGICEYCHDAGWLAPCTYIVTGVAQYSEGDRTAYQSRICADHIVAMAENFRDIGK